MAEENENELDLSFGDDEFVVGNSAFQAAQVCSNDDFNHYRSQQVSYIKQYFF